MVTDIMAVEAELVLGIININAGYGTLMIGLNMQIAIQIF